MSAPRRRTGLLLFATAAILLGIFWSAVEPVSDIFWLNKKRDRSPLISKGERIRFDQLQPGETIAIENLSIGHRRDNAWSYRLEGGAPGRLTAVEQEVQWTDGKPVVGKTIEVEVFDIGKRDLTALALHWEGLRMPIPHEPQYGDTYTVEYFRAGQKVGTEKFIVPGDSLFPLVTRYEDLPPQWALQYSEAQWKARRSFQQLLGDLRTAREAGDTKPN